MIPAPSPLARDCISLLEGWDGAELALATAEGGASLKRSSGELVVELPTVPGSVYMVPRGLGDTLPLHWTNVLAGMACWLRSLARGGLRDRTNGRLVPLEVHAVFEDNRT